jgi:chaperonin cofactor prefoldin
MNPSVIQFLGRFGMKEEEAEREFAYLQSHPPLLEYYYTFIRSLTGAAMASQCVFSQLVKDGREGESTAECISKGFSVVLSSSSLPGANMIGALSEYLGKMIGDIDRKKSIERLSKTFPSSSSLSCIEILGRQITLMQEEEITSLSLSSSSASASGKKFSDSSLKKKMTSTWKWLNNGGILRNEIESYAEEQVAGLLEKIMSNDLSLSLENSSSSVDVMERLIEWITERSFKAWKKSYVLPSLLPVVAAGALSGPSSSTPPIPPMALRVSPALLSPANDVTQELAKLKAELQESRDKLSQLNLKVQTLETSSKKSNKTGPSPSEGNGPMLALSKPDVLDAEAADGTTRYQQLTQKIERLECNIVSVQKGLIQQESYLTEQFEEINSRFASLEKLNESLRFIFFAFRFVRSLSFFFISFLFLD